MKPDESNLNEAERQRQELLKEFSAERAQDDAGNYRLGSFGCHELLDRTALIMRLLEEQVVEHPACFQRPDWFFLAHEATATLNRLYQEVGREHLSVREQGSP